MKILWDLIHNLKLLYLIPYFYIIPHHRLKNYYRSDHLFNPLWYCWLLYFPLKFRYLPYKANSLAIDQQQVDRYPAPLC